MATFTVVHAGRESAEPFSNYVFDVLVDGQRVAELGHDYRGDEHWIREPGGEWKALPGRVLAGGGPEPLELSLEGVRAVQALFADRQIGRAAR